MDNIFEKIITREIPATIVYEDDVVLAFLDIKPANKGHTLVVPKKKFRNILDGDRETVAHMMTVAQKLAIAIKAATGADGINVSMSNEPAAGQEVFHAHLHVIPRFEGDHVFAPARHTSYTDGEMDALAEKIVAAL